MPYLFLALSIVGEVTGTLSLKASHGMTRLLPSLVVVLAYALSFWFLSQTLKTLPVGFVYGVWSGVGVIAVTLAGVVLFGEAMTALKMAGAVLIVAGVAMMKLGGEA